MKPKHTPGEWLARTYDHLTDEIEVSRADGEYVCSIDVDGQYDREAWPQIKANACLIAAAPDMYEALLHARQNMPHPDQMIDDAIAKAEGRE